jgi:CoA-transferase family III
MEVVTNIAPHTRTMGWSACASRTAVNPSLGAAGKTCNAMRSCIAASQGSPSLANPLVACDEPLFFTLRETHTDQPLGPDCRAVFSHSEYQRRANYAKPSVTQEAHVSSRPAQCNQPILPTRIFEALLLGVDQKGVMRSVKNREGLIHAKVVLHGERGPWSNRVGFDEIGAAVSGLFTIEGTPTQPKSPAIIPICDNVVGWLGTVGVLEALRRRAVEGGSYRVVVSLTRTVLWLLSMGIFDKGYAEETAGSTDEHTYVAPDLFTAETPLGTYQGFTDQVVLSRTPGAFRTVLVPRGSSKPEWLA